MSSSVFGAIPAKKSPQLQLVLDFLNAFSDKDFDKLYSLITDDYVHSVVPKDLGAPPVTRTEWIPRIKELLGIFNEFKVSNEELWQFLLKTLISVLQFEILEIVESQSVLTVHVCSPSAKSSVACLIEQNFLHVRWPPLGNQQRARTTTTNTCFSSRSHPTQKAL